MKRLRLLMLGIAFCACLAPVAWAQVSSVLIEACSMLEPASKRISCLQEANQAGRQSNAERPAPLYQAPAHLAPNQLQAAPTPNSSYVTPSGKTCYVGPRGGTYTITKSGGKNYGGC